MPRAPRHSPHRRPDKPATALIARDPERTAGRITRVLHRRGYRVLEASGAVEVQRLAASRGRIELLFIDSPPGDTSGLELARWFQAHYPDSNILIATGALWDLLYRMGEQERFAVLVKPFSNLELDRMLRQLPGDGLKPSRRGMFLTLGAGVAADEALAAAV